MWICSYVLVYLTPSYKYPNYILLHQTLVTHIHAFMENHGIKILDILSKQNNKQELIQQVINNQVSLETMIMSEQYYLTDLDLWLLCDFYKLPVLLISDDSLETLHLNVPWLVMGGNKDVDVYYLYAASMNPKYLDTK